MISRNLVGELSTSCNCSSGDLKPLASVGTSLLTHITPPTHTHITEKEIKVDALKMHLFKKDSARMVNFYKL